MTNFIIKLKIKHMKTKILGLILLMMSVNCHLTHSHQLKQLQLQQILHLNNRKSSTFQNRNGIGWQTKM